MANWSSAQSIQNKGAKIVVKQNTHLRTGTFNNTETTSKLNLSGQLSLTKNLINDGNILGQTNSKVLFYGNIPQEILGTQIPLLSILEINNAANNLILKNGIRIKNNLLLTDGNLFSEDAPVFFTSTSLNPIENNANRIIGTAIMEDRTFGTTAIPLFLDFSANTGTDIGNLKLTRKTVMQGIVDVSGNQSIASLWQTESSLDIDRTLNFSWLSALDNGSNLSQMQLWKSDNLTSWTAKNFPYADMPSRAYSYAATNSVGYWTLADQVNYLAPRAIIYLADTLKEKMPENLGNIETIISITTQSAIFSGTNGNDLVANGLITVSNIPAGLTAQIIKIDDYTLQFSLILNATLHTSNENIDNLTVIFSDAAFANGVLASEVTGSTNNTLKVRFFDASTGGGGGGTSGGGSTPIVCEAPKNFDAIAIDSTTILLRWTNQPSVLGYQIYRFGQLIATLNANQDSLLDQNLIPSTWYQYQIRTLCEENKKSIYATDSVRTLPPNPFILPFSSICGQGKQRIIAQGKIYTDGIYRWYDSPISTTPIFESSSPIFETPFITQTTTFYVSLLEYGRESERIPFIVIVKPVFEARILNPTNDNNQIFSCQDTLTLFAKTYPNATYQWKYNAAFLTDTTSSLLVTKNGKYQLVVTIDSCQQISEEVEVLLNYKPIAQILPTSSSNSDTLYFCEKGFLVATNQTDLSMNVSYKWFLRDSLISTNKEIEVNQSGKYKLVVINDFGCQAIDSIKVEITNFPKKIELSALPSAICSTDSTLLQATFIENATYTWFFENEVIAQTDSSFLWANSEGIYRVKAQSKNRICPAITDTTEVFHYSIPTVSISKNDTELVVQITPDSTGFIWQFSETNEFENFEDIQGSNNKLNFIPSKSGYYRLYYQNPCVYYTNNLYFEIEKAVPSCPEFSVYPNPSSDKISVCLGYKAEKVRVELVDAIGKKIKEVDFVSITEFELNVAAYAQGMYILNITTEKETRSVKIIKE